jgi:iron(III) transport system substrate-binding protein
MRDVVAKFLLAAGMVLGPLVHASAEQASLDALYAAAKNEPALTWYQVPLSQVAGERIVAAFARKYPGLTVQTQRSPAQTHFQKISQEIAANAPGGDIFTSSVVGHLAKLKSDGQLLQYVPQSVATMTDKLPGVKNIDPDGYYHTTLVDHVSIVFNTAQLRREVGPDSYKALLDANWKGKAAVPNPAASGTFGALAISLSDTYGPTYFSELAKNEAMVVRSLPDAINAVKSGERMVGIGPAPFALAAKQQGQPIDVIYPTEGVLVSLCPSGILKKTKSPNAAKLFMEFLHSAETSEIVATEFNEPLHDSVQMPKGVVRLTDLKIIVIAPEETDRKLKAVLDSWRSAFGM